MARRITGGIKVRRRPNGGAVLILKSATGEAFEIERSADQIAALRKELAAPEHPKTPTEPAPAPEAAADGPKARSKTHA